MYEAKRYRKRPVVIEAFQINDRRDVMKACDWVCDNGGTARPLTLADTGMEIDTLEGKHTASLGDWILRGVAGEFYPCKPDIFDQTYEPAE